MSSEAFQAARIRWQGARAARTNEGMQTLPSALQTDLQALRAAGLDFRIASVSLAPRTEPPLREICADEVLNLDARDPRRAMFSYQRSYACLGQLVPRGIVANLRAAWRDEQIRRRRISLDVE
ncbi:MAG: hypothetical protein AB1412_01980 [Pseudomonadota bacterium]